MVVVFNFRRWRYDRKNLVGVYSEFYYVLLSDRKDFAVFRKRKYNYADIRTVYLGI